MPDDILDFTAELAQRFPDLEDADVIQAVREYSPHAAFIRRQVIETYTDNIDRTDRLED